MPSNEWPKQLNPDSVVPGDAMSEEPTFRSELGEFQKTFNSFKKFKSFKPPPLFLPRVAGEDEGGGLNGLNGLSAKGRISPKLFG
jgi:hypothetical protein